jgi:hypothetical protein
MNKVDVRIMGVPQRMGFIRDMLKQLESDQSIVAFDDRPKGGCGMYTARKCWLAPVPEGVTHRLVLQDDLDLCDGFKEIVEQIVGTWPKAFITLFSALVRFEHKKIQSPYVLVPGSSCYGPAIVLPVEQVSECFAWIDKHLGLEYPHDDRAISEFAIMHRIPIITTIPSTVQHLAPTASLLGYNNKRKVSKVWRGRSGCIGENWESARYSIGPTHPNNLRQESALPYNTALKIGCRREFERDSLPEVEWYENDRGIIFQHDVCLKPKRRMLAAYRKAECVCTDLAWTHGYEAFAVRAQIKQSGDHAAYVCAIGKLVKTLKLPSFVIAGWSFVKALSPDLITSLELNERPAALAVWNAELPSASTDAELIAELAKRYRSVADFCCGYGRALRAFSWFVGSDIDKKCLGYIKTEIMPKPLVEVFAEERL